MSKKTVLSLAVGGMVLASGCQSLSEIGGNDPNFYPGTDSERIEQALKFAQANSLPLEITARRPNGSDQRDHWLIDRAILLPEDMEMRIVDCKIKLSDQCRDNIIRSANSIPSSEPIRKLRNIRICGVGEAVLEGADRPRSTGDGGKQLGVQTFGTDAGKSGESQKGDWRNIGILLTDVDGFEISNLKLVNTHCWAISLEYCTRGKLKDLAFDSRGNIVIGGKAEKVLNQDGIDLRRGCQYIEIENISGCTGDDLVALTGIGVTEESPHSGVFPSTMFSAPRRRGAADDIHHVTIRNVNGYCAGGHHIIRLLNNRNVKLHDVLIDGLNDTSRGQIADYAAVKIGDKNYGGYAPLGDTYNITVRNVRSYAQRAILIQGSLADSVLEDITSVNPEYPVISVVSPIEYVRNVKFPPGLRQAGDRSLNYFAQ